jgi:hypothetical protein
MAYGSAFLLKEATVSELTKAIEQVLKGSSYVTASAAQGLKHVSLRAPKDWDLAPEPTPRQREVLQLLAEGRSMKEIAFELHIAKRTGSVLRTVAALLSESFDLVSMVSDGRSALETTLDLKPDVVVLGLHARNEWHRGCQGAYEAAQQGKDRFPHHSRRL